MSYAAMGSQVSGMAFGTAGALIEGQQKSDLLNYQAKIQSHNAYEATAAASLNADRQDLIAAKIIGGTKAGYAAAGVDASSGSVLSVIAASAANSELDRQNILHGGAIRATNYENQASMDTLGAQNAIKASYFNALGSLAGGGSKLAEQYGDGGGSGTQLSTQGVDTSVSAPLEGGEMGWYPDEGPGGSPGFYGKGPRGSYA